MELEYTLKFQIDIEEMVRECYEEKALSIDKIYKAVSNRITADNLINSSYLKNINDWIIDNIVIEVKKRIDKDSLL